MLIDGHMKLSNEGFVVIILRDWRLGWGGSGGGDVVIILRDMRLGWGRGGGGVMAAPISRIIPSKINPPVAYIS